MFFKKTDAKETEQQTKVEEEENPGIFIDCRVDMNVKLPNSVVIGSNGLLNGNITAQQIVVQGKVYGNIVGTEKVILKDGASVIGQIISKSLRIDGSVNGEIDLKISRHNTFPDLSKELLNSKTDEEKLQNLLASSQVTTKSKIADTTSELREIEIQSVNGDRKKEIESHDSTHSQKQKSNFW